MTYLIFLLISTLACVVAGLIHYTNDDNSWRDLPIGTKKKPETVNKIMIICIIWAIIEIGGAILFI